MGLFAGAMRWVADVGSAILRNPFDPRYWGGPNTVSHSGQVVNADTAFQLDVVQSILSRLSGTISILPMLVIERKGEDKVLAPDHPLQKLLRRPNRLQTGQEFWSEVVSFLAFWRNAYWLIHPSEDGLEAIGELELIHPSRLKKIERRADRRIYYTFARLAPQLGDDIYRDDELTHIRMGPLTVDGLRGRYVFETAKETFGRALAVEQYGALFFRNGGAGSGVIEYPGKFASKEARDDFMEAWRSTGSGFNAHKDRLLLNGAKYTPFKVNNNEAQFLETLQECGLKLCRLWNMPPHMVGIMSQTTFNNMEQQAIEYVVYGIAPFLVAIEQAVVRDLLIGEDQNNFIVEHNVDGLLRGDFKTRMQGYAWGRQWGWLSVNMILRKEGEPTIGPAGDIFLQPMNMNAAGSPAADAESVEPGGPGIDDPVNPDAAAERHRRHA